MSEEMLRVKDIAESWGLSVRRINQLCNAGQIEGAVKIGGLWKIPFDAPMPEAVRARKRNPHNLATRLLPCPVGITSYKEVSSECYYVDKTLLIKDIIDEHNKVTLFTRPRRFGKTLTMDMVKTFFEKTEEDTSVFFANRAIWACGDSYRSYQGKFPVIFISFKDAHQTAWKDMYESLCLSLRNEFKRHMSVLKSPAVTEVDKDFVLRMLKGDVTEVECQASLGALSHILADAYGTRVVVIIDEYDTPIQQGYANGYYSQIIAFMRNLFSAVLKDNASLEIGLLTGILRIAKESLFSGLNNLTVNTILDEKYSDYFGFSAQEVEEMAAYYGQSGKLSEIREWYDGYRFGNAEIYNPWSVISYFSNHCIPKAFWSRTSSNDMILDIIRNGDPAIQQSLMKLLQDQPVRGLIDTDIIYPEIESSEDTIYSFLLMTGYLKISEIDTMIDDAPVCEMLIPNKEIKGVFKKEILDQLSKNVAQSVLRDFQFAMKTGQSDELENALRQYLLQCVSSFDTAQENFYHGLMLGLLVIMSDDYRISSNRESGTGRYDIQLKPFIKTKPGMLMEFKAAGEANDIELSHLAENAIKQVREKKYATELIADGISDIRIYGIAFCKKNAVVKAEKYTV